MVKAYEPLYTVKEVAKLLKTNPQSIYRLIDSKQIVSLRLGSIKMQHFGILRSTPDTRMET